MSTSEIIALLLAVYIMVGFGVVVIASYQIGGLKAYRDIVADQFKDITNITTLNIITVMILMYVILTWPFHMMKKR